MRGGRLGDHRGYGLSGSCSRPAVSASPMHEVERLHGLAGGALDEVVDDADRDDPPGALVEADVDPREVAAGHGLRRRWCRPDLHERLAGVGVARTASSSSACVTDRVGRT